MTKLLVLCKDLDAPGGVSNFVQSIIKHLPSDVSAERLTIGRPTGSETFIQSVISPVRDNVRLICRVIAGRPDLVQLNPSLNWSSLLRDGLFLLTLRALRYRHVIVYFHGWSDTTAESIAHSSWKKAVFSWVFGRARIVCVLASRFQDSLVGFGLKPDTIEVCTTMFDSKIFDGVERCADTAGCQFLFLGRIVRAKGIFEVLHAFAAITKEFPSARLHIAGSGEDLNEVKIEVSNLGISERTHFAGYVSGEQKAQLLLDSDVFVFPTYYPEGCPVSLLEAMAAGLPVLSGNAGGIPDIVKDDIHGVVLSEVSNFTVERGMRRLLKELGNSAEISLGNRSYAWERFSASTVVEKLLVLYRRAAANPWH